MWLNKEISIRWWNTCKEHKVYINDALALKKSSIAIAVDYLKTPACSASDIVLAELGLGVIISGVQVSRTILDFKQWAIAC